MDTKLEIVIVDDDPGHCELIRRNLKRAGLANNLTTLSNGQDALDFIYCQGDYLDRSPNKNLLLLLDVNMPGVDGLQVLKRIKNDSSKKHIPIVMLTTTDNPREIQECYKLGCSVYVTKPVEPDAFIDAIRRLGLFIAVFSVPPESSDPAL